MASYPDEYDLTEVDLEGMTPVASDNETSELSLSDADLEGMTPLSDLDLEGMVPFEEETTLLEDAADIAKVGGAGITNALLGMGESIWRTPDMLKRGYGALHSMITGTELPDEYNPISYISEGFAIGDYKIEGTTGLAERIGSSVQTLPEMSQTFADVAEAGVNADKAFNEALGGEFTKLGQVVKDPKAWSGFIGQAVPSLFAAWKSGGSMTFMAWLEGMEQAGSAAEFEKVTGQKIDDETYTTSVLATGMVNGALEKMGLESILKGKGSLARQFFGGMTGEAATEGAQSFSGNLISRLYDKDASLTEGILPGMMGGAGTGGPAGFMSGVVNKMTPPKDALDEISDKILGDIETEKEILSLPAPVIVVTPEGVAATEASMQAAEEMGLRGEGFTMADQLGDPEIAPEGTIDFELPDMEGIGEPIRGTRAGGQFQDWKGGIPFEEDLSVDDKESLSGLRESMDIATEKGDIAGKQKIQSEIDVFLKDKFTVLQLQDPDKYQPIRGKDRSVKYTPQDLAMDLSKEPAVFPEEALPATELPSIPNEEYNAPAIQQTIKKLKREKRESDKSAPKTVLHDIASRGQIDWDMAVAEGFDPADMIAANKKGMPFGKPLFKKGSGNGFDSVAEKLSELGVAGFGTGETYQDTAYSANDAINLVGEMISGKREPVYMPGTETAELERQQKGEALDNTLYVYENLLEEVGQYEAILENEGQEAADEFYYQQRAMEGYEQEVGGEFWVEGDEVTVDTNFDQAGETLANLLDQAVAADPEFAAQEFERLVDASDAQIARAMHNIIKGGKDDQAVETTEYQEEQRQKQGDIEAEPAEEEQGRRLEQREVDVEQRQAERRIEPVKRKRVSEMTEEEKDVALLTNKKSGLRNERAYEEDEQLAHQSFFDIDNFKQINDVYTYDGADKILKAFGDIMLDAANENVIPYHLHGDEFIVQSNSPMAIKAFSEKVQKALNDADVTIEFPNGEVKIATNIGASYGIAKTKEQAESNLKKDKAARAEAGLRTERERDTGGLPEQAAREGEDTEGRVKAEQDLDLAFDELGDLLPGAKSAAEISEAAANAEGHTASQAQIDAGPNGNFKKGHLFNMQGFKLSIENEAGTKRNKMTPAAWPVLAHHYGDVTGTTGADGDPIDVFIKKGADVAADHPIYVINQNNKSGKFDEVKVLFGFDSETDAKQGYLDSYSSDFTGFGEIHKSNADELKNWIDHDDTTKRYDSGKARASLYARVSGVATDEGAMPQPEKQAVLSLRGKGDKGLQGVEGELSGVLQRDGKKAGREDEYREDREQQRLLEEELPLGDTEGTVEEQAQQQMDRVRREKDDTRGLGEPSIDKRSGTEVEAAGVRMERGESADYTGELAKKELEDADVQREDATDVGMGERIGDELQDVKKQDIDSEVADRKGANEIKATEILDAADVRGKDRLDAMSKFRSGEYSLDDLTAAYPASEPAPAEEEKIEYPIANKGEWYGDADYIQRGGEMVNMSPDEYLGRVRPLEVDEESRENIDILKAHIEAGKTLDPLAIYEDGSEDGRHRAHAAKELGIKSVPVILFGEQIEKKATPAEKITDVGEKIGGARKDVWSGFREKATAELSNDEILSLPLSKSFPEPNYAKLAEQGADPQALAIIKAVRDEIPAKGKSNWKKKRYLDSVNILKDLANNLLSDPAYAQQFIDGAAETDTLGAIADKVELMIELGFPASGIDLKGITLKKIMFSIYNGEKNVSKWIVDDTAKSRKSMGGMGGQIAAADTREEAVTALKKHLENVAKIPKGKKITKFEIYKYRNELKRGWVIGKKVGRNYIDLNEGFDTSAEAVEYMESNRSELEENLDKKKKIPAHRRPVNEARLGDDYRGGKDVTAEDLRDTFGFRGVEFGNWVQQSKRQFDVNEAYDGLMDLAKLLDIPPEAISLNGELGLAFGARGKGGKLAAKAHYEPDKIVINLTKKDGAGSLAHEWWHSLDNYFSRMRGEKISYVTERPYELMDKAVRKEMIDRFKAIHDAIKDSGLPKRAAVLDGRRAKAYWSTGREMAARSFESYLINKLKEDNLSNDYLVNIVSQEYWDAAEALGLEDESSYPYALEDEQGAINDAYDDFFDTVETKETDEGVMLFSKTSFTPNKPEAIKGITEAQAEEALKVFLKEMGKPSGVKVFIAPTKKSAMTDEAYSKFKKDQVRGFYKSGTEEIGGGRIVLILEDIESVEKAVNVLRHEWVAHHGLNTFNPADKKKIINRIRSSKGEMSLKAAWAHVEKNYPNASPEIQAEELLAYMAENKATRLSKLWNDLVLMIQNALKKMGLIGKGKITKAEVVRFVEDLASRVGAGAAQQTFEGDVAYSKADTNEASVQLTPAEIEYFSAIFDSDADLIELREAAPSVRIDDNVFYVNKDDIAGLTEYIDQTVIRREVGQKIPPRFASDKFMKNLETQDFDMEDVDIMYSKERVKGSPEQEAAMADTIAAKDHDKPWRTRIKGFFDRIRAIDSAELRQGFIDEFNAIAEYEKGEFSEVQDASLSASKAARRTKNLDSVMAAILMAGPIEYRDGAFQLKKGGKGFNEIFDELSKKGLIPLWEAWAGANRANRLIRENKEQNFTQEQIDVLLMLEHEHLGENGENLFRNALEEYQNFNKQILDMAESVGVIDPEARALWESNDYVPFYRAMEEIAEGGAEVIGPKGKGGIQGQRSGIKKLIGGEEKVNSIIENMVLNTAHLVDASFKNVAMQRVVELTEDVAMEAVDPAFQPVGIDAGQMVRALRKIGVLPDRNTAIEMEMETGVPVGFMTSEEQKTYLNLFRRVAPAGNDIVSVMVDGKAKYYRVNDRLLLRSITNMGVKNLDEMMKVMRGAKRLLTKMVTIDPGFMIANFMRDTLSTVVVSHAGLKPGIDAVKGFMDAMNEDPALMAIMAAGGGGGGFYHATPAETQANLHHHLNEMRDKDFKETVLDSPKKLWNAWQKVGAASENANRIAIFKKIKETGGTTAEAVHQAQDILNFTQTGDFATMKFLIETVPFMNARVQGLDRLYRGAREDPKAFMVKGMMLAAASMAIVAANWDDEEYDELPEWDKDTYWHFFLGEKDKNGRSEYHFRLPKPFEVGAIFATIPERIARAVAGKDDAKTSAEAAGRMIGDTFALNPIPQLFKPMAEQYMDKMFFTGSPIVGRALENVAPEAQYTAWTSEAMRALAESLPDDSPEWLRSPKRLEAALRGYTGTMGSYVLAAADVVVREAGDYPDAPTISVSRYPVLGRFMRGSPTSTKFTNEFYDAVDQANEAYSTIKKYREEGELGKASALRGESMNLLGARKKLNRYARKIGEINNKIKRLQSNRMMTAKKKGAEIDRLTQIKMDLQKKGALLK